MGHLFIINRRLSAVAAFTCLGLSAIFPQAYGDHGPVLVASSFTPALTTLTPLLPTITDESPSSETPNLFKVNLQHRQALDDDTTGSKRLGRHGRSRRSKEVVSSAIQLDTHARTIGGQLTDGDATKLRPAQKYLFRPFK